MTQSLAKVFVSPNFSHVVSHCNIKLYVKAIYITVHNFKIKEKKIDFKILIFLVEKLVRPKTFFVYLFF